ncbi:hypothetical protein [Streptacidiphilus albus]|uniref:hypothetical protein n=1 Tax=Streptacidiphilus albus TaxID=105425 RepID=UPI00054BD916|nr:hypothetical protein [Streptacidiphilus albus]
MSIRARKTLQSLAWGVGFTAANTIESLLKSHGHFAITWWFVALVALWIIIIAKQWWLYGPSVKAVEKRAVLEEKAERKRNQEQRAANRRVPSKPDAE